MFLSEILSHFTDPPILTSDLAETKGKPIVNDASHQMPPSLLRENFDENFDETRRRDSEQSLETNQIKVIHMHAHIKYPR